MSQSIKLNIMCKVKFETVDNLVANSEEIIVKDRKNSKKKTLDIFLTDEATMFNLAEKFAKTQNISLTGVGEIGTVILKTKTEKENVEVLHEEEIHDQFGWENKPGKQAHKAKKSSNADKNELPAGVPILCWKFYGRQRETKVAVIFTFNSNKNRAVIPLENMLNNTTAKKSVEINGVKYKIEHDAKNKKVLVLV